MPSCWPCAARGKSLTAAHYGAENPNVYVLACSEYWNRKTFLRELLRVMGKNPAGDTVGDMVDDVVMALKRRENPLIILDEADKLSDQVMFFFITFYNKLEDYCGIVLMATDYLEKKVRRGLRLNKKGSVKLKEYGADVLRVVREFRGGADGRDGPGERGSAGRG